MLDLQAILQSRSGFSAFREGQEEAIRAAPAGKRVLLIQPTGWGKSLVYQMIAAVKGLTLVFSPLRALMRDQVRQANERFGLRTETVNSDMEEEAQQVVASTSAGAIAWHRKLGGRGVMEPIHEAIHACK